MQNIFVRYVYQLNAIILQPKKSREISYMVEAFQQMYEYLKNCGFKPKLGVMGNDCSQAVNKHFMRETTFQFVEATNNRVNAADPVMQTIKNHFLAGLATVVKEFPIQLWCVLLPQF